MVTEREIEKLKALGYAIKHIEHGPWFTKTTGCKGGWDGPIGGCGQHRPTAEKCWADSLAEAQSPEGMATTMAAKCAQFNDLRLLRLHSTWAATSGAIGVEGYETPEAAVDALYWAVP